MSIQPYLGNGILRARDPQGEMLHAVSWRGGALLFESRRWVCRDAELTWTAPQHVAILTETGGTARTETRFGEQISYRGCDQPGVLSFVPAGAERTTAYRSADLVYSALWIDPDLGRDLLGDEKHLPPLANGSETVVAMLLKTLKADIVAERRPDATYVEHLAGLALSRIAALDGADARGPDARLAGPALRRVQDYVEANLGADISLSDMAAAANMPVARFSRRFKAAMGVPPWVYVMTRRLRRAETLLAETTTPIGALALALGFSSQSHFTTVFRRAIGLTPRAYRMQFSSDS